MPMKVQVKKATTPELEISYETSGPDDGPAVLLLHGWPYSLRCYDAVVGPLAESGLRVIVPELRGFGKTKYRNQSVMRTAQQSALGKDILDLMDALKIETAALAGYDWGGRGACVAAALWPERVAGLVTMQGYSIVDRKKQSTEPPEDAKAIHNNWYRWVMQIKLGETILEEMRDEFTAECWRTFSPKTPFSESQFREQARTFDNPDWVATTLQQYRWWYANAEGSPELEPLEEKLAKRPKIACPTIAPSAIRTRCIRSPRRKGRSGSIPGRMSAASFREQDIALPWRLRRRRFGRSWIWPGSLADGDMKNGLQLHQTDLCPSARTSHSRLHPVEQPYPDAARCRRSDCSKPAPLLAPDADRFTGAATRSDFREKGRPGLGSKLRWPDRFWE